MQNTVCGFKVTARIPSLACWNAQLQGWLSEYACPKCSCWTLGLTCWQSCGSWLIESGYGSGSSISSESGSRVLMTKNRKKTSRKFFYIFFWSKIAIYLCPSYRRSLQPSKETIQLLKKWNLTFFYVWGSFYPLGAGYRSGLRIPIRIQIQGPLWIRNQSGYESGSTALHVGIMSVNIEYAQAWDIRRRVFTQFKPVRVDDIGTGK